MVMVLRRLAQVGTLLVMLSLGIVPPAAHAQDVPSQQYVSPSGHLTFSYPAGWVAIEDQGMLIVTNNVTALNEATIPPGTVGFIVVEPPLLSTITFDVSDMSPESATAALAEEFSYGELDAVPAPEAFTLGGQSQGDRHAARVLLSLEVGDVLVMAMDVGDGNVLSFVGVTATGEMTQFETDLLGIAASAEYTPLWRTTIYGHEDWVNSVAFSPDGAQLASASDDDMVRVWDVTSGAELFAMEHPQYVYGVAYHPEGTVLASACQDSIVRIWDAATGDSVAVLEGHTSAVQGVAFSPDGMLLASASDDYSARVWDITTGTERLNIEHPGSVKAIAFNPDGTLLATGGTDSIIRVLDIASGEAVTELPGHTDYIRGVAFSPDGTLLASGSDDETVRVWKTNADGLFDELAVLPGHTDYVRTVAFSPDGTLLASGSDDRVVLLWNVPR